MRKSQAPLEDSSTRGKTPGKKKITSPRPGSDRNACLPAELVEQSVMAALCGYVITDCGQKDSPVVFVNHAFQKITGYKANEILGRNCRFLKMRDFGMVWVTESKNVAIHIS